MSVSQLLEALSNGGRLVSYGYCISVVALTYRLMSSPYFIGPDEKRSKCRFRYNLISSLFGWWGLPWGPIYTIDMIKISYKTGGGIDITDELIDKIKLQYADLDPQIILPENLTVDYTAQELIY